jgi:hypothetical protein
MTCPLCLGSEQSLYDQDKFRNYFLCHQCELVFVPRESLISLNEENKRYQSHQNNQNDKSYENYLTQIAELTFPYLEKPCRGLDFGCGETNLMSLIYQKANIQMDSYDIFFHLNEDIWKKKYHFILLSEVIEHLRDPREVMNQLMKMLEDDGQIFIKTKFYPFLKSDFTDWFYKRDKTHIQFFNHQALSYFGLNVDQIGNDLYRLSNH